LSKFQFNKQITIVEYTNIFQEITNEGSTIKGERLATKKHNKIVYVFDGFLSDKKWVKEMRFIVDSKDKRYKMYNRNHSRFD